MRQATAKNSVAFLLDEEFFVQLHRSLRTLINAHVVVKQDAPIANAYVRIGMWVCHYDTMLPAYDAQPQTTLLQLIEELSARAISVQLLLWEGSAVPSKSGESISNMAMKDRTYELPHVEAQLAVYDPREWIVRSSNHRKVIIINDGGTLEALVGGFNLGTNYYSTTDHGKPTVKNWKNGNEKWKSNLWHDAAVSLKGPAALAVETVWADEWNQKRYTWNRSLSARHEMCDPECKEATQAVVAGGQGTPGNASITIATTALNLTTKWLLFSSETHETDIRDLLVEKINGAKKYVYIENYALTDPAIIKALRAKIAEKVKVIVMVHHPKSKMFEADQVWSFLMFFTLIGLSAPVATKIGVNNIKDPLTGDDHRFWIPDTPNQNNSLKAISEFYGARVNYMKKFGHPKNFLMRDVTSLSAPSIMFAPRRKYNYGAGGNVDEKIEYPYVHSKVAIIDDETAFVGSSNWTHRSMVNDGEISAAIDSKPDVSAFRSKLFKHWGVTSGAVNDWPTNSPEPASGEVKVQALSFNDFRKPTEGSSYTSGSCWIGWIAPYLF